MLSIVPVVEGDGEFAAIPLLLRRILYEKYNLYNFDVGQPVNTRGGSKLVNEFEKFLRHAQGKPECGAILVLLNSDDGCPKELAANLAARCNQTGVGKPVAIVCATREYEAWFLASLETIRGNSGIPESASFSGNAETLREVKEWLTQQMPQGQAYKPTLHQASLTQRMDLELAHANSRSFQRLCHAVEQLVDVIDQGTVATTP
jgi:hypothetical protein